MYSGLLKNIKGIQGYRERFIFLYQLLISLLRRCKIQLLNLIRKPLPRPVKITFACIAGIFSILVIATFMIDPNQYKSTLEKLVLDRTGQTLILEGPLQLRCFPTFALEANNIILKEKPNKKRAILKIQSLKIYPGMGSLIPGRTVFSVALKDAQIKSFFLPTLDTKVTHKKGIYDLTAIQIGVKRGKKLKTLEIDNFKVNTSEEVLKYNLYHHGGNFELELLLAMFGMKNHLVGKTSLQIELNAEGNTLRYIKKSLSGNVEIKISNGRFHGIDLITSLRDAKSILGTIASGVAKPFVAVIDTIGTKENKLLTQRTPFKALKIKAVIKDGIIHNHDLNIHHKHYGVKGKGKINLNHGTVEYRLNAHYKGPGIVKKKKPLKKKLAPLIIDISGPIDNPNIKPDFDSYLEYLK